jgi:hypothetical protein
MKAIFQNKFAAIETDGEAYIVRSLIGRFATVSFTSLDAACKYLGIAPPIQRFTFNADANTKWWKQYL